MFPERLASAIKQKGVKKSALARAVGVTPGNLSRYLNGTIVPRHSVMLVLAKELSVPLNYLQGATVGTDERPTVAKETESVYIPDAVALTGLDDDERRTVLRLLDALRSGEPDIRRHLIGQLKIIEDAVRYLRMQPRSTRKDAS